jgi:large subunit ribosomal protein L24e
MAAAAPGNLERDVLEVTRGHHLLGQTPSEKTLKALAAAQRQVEAKQARRLARQMARKTTKAPQEDVAMEAEQAEVSLVDAIGSAMVTDAVVEAPIKQKIRVKATRKSALVPAASSRDMDLS